MTEVASIVTSPFQSIGGQPAVDRLVDLFYDRMDTLPEARAIRAMHPADLTGIRIVLKKYFAEWLGGPNTYSEERGHPRLRQRHLPFPIGIAERDAWMLCMNGALEEVITDQALREHLSGQLLRLADWMRNREG
jgi:hemoglobin